MLNICLKDECNQHCIHCYVNPKQTPNKLRLDDYKVILQRFLKMGLENVHVFGGEPFLHEDLGEFLEYLHEKNLTTSLVTNATLLKKDVLEIIKKNNIFLGITVHGKREIHDDITRKPGSHAKVIEFIKHCVSHDINFGIMTCLHVKNIDDYFEMVKNLKALGAKSFFIIYFSPLGRGTQNLSISNDKWLKFLEDVKYKKTSLDLEIYHEPSIIKKGDHKTSLYFEAFYCHAFENPSIVIDSKGDMYPCILLMNNKKYYLGSALNENLSFQPLEKNIPVECTNCELSKSNCESGCPAYYFESTDFRCKKGKYYPLCPLATYLL